MKKLSKALLIGALLAGFNLTAHAQVYYVDLNTVAPAGANNEGNADPEDFDIGTSFTVGSSNILVTELGAWGGAGYSNGAIDTEPTLPESTTAYLWDSSNNLLGSVSLTAGQSATTASSVSGQGWAFGSLATPILLTAGDTYYISNETFAPTAQTDADPATPGLGYTRLPASDLTVGSGIEASSMEGAYTGQSPGAAPAFPGSDAGSPTYGGNFEYTVVPEPTTWVMMLGGIAALVLVRRARRDS